MLSFRVVARSVTGPRRDPQGCVGGLGYVLAVSARTSRVKDGPKDILPSMTRDEKITEVVGTVSSLTPLLGGPLSSILMGISGDRRFDRVRKVIIELAERLGDVEADREAFVRSEDFEDLLIETLQRVAAERDEGKRLGYRNILLNAVRDATQSYDETLRFLRVLEQLQPDHVEVLRAYETEPAESNTLIGGSRRHTLGNRLPEMPAEHVDDLVVQLEDLRLTTGSLQGMVTGPSAVDLRPLITPFGRRFLMYVVEAE
jgi:hypothetical protein